MSEEALNGDLRARVVVDSASLEWQPSPGGGVLRRRLHRVGPEESGQVTSVVRYLPGSSFPAHDHPDGEEILVLDGVFSDEHGDWPAGSYLLNPEGFRHAPFSREGCRIFVKLRQFGGASRRHVALQTRDLEWQRTSRPGVESKPLYADASQPDAMQLERFEPGAEAGRVEYPGGVEIFVLAGSFEDAEGRYEKDVWLRLPPGSQHSPRSAAGCELYVKTGGVAGLRSGLP